MVGSRYALALALTLSTCGGPPPSIPASHCHSDGWCVTECGGPHGFQAKAEDDPCWTLQQTANVGPMCPGYGWREGDLPCWTPDGWTPTWNGRRITTVQQGEFSQDTWNRLSTNRKPESQPTKEQT